MFATSHLQFIVVDSNNVVYFVSVFHTHKQINCCFFISVYFTKCKYRHKKEEVTVEETVKEHHFQEVRYITVI